MKIVPIGSVVRIAGRQFIVTGYQPIEDHSAVALAYVLLPYPMGFIRRDNFLLCPARSVEEVVSAGYMDERGERYLKNLEAFAESGKEADYEEFVQFMSHVKKKLGNEQEVER